MEPIAATIEADDQLVAHHRGVSDAERFRGQLAGELGGHPRSGGQRVQLAAAADATGNAVHHHQRHAAAPPGQIVAEPGGRHDGTGGEVQLGKAPSSQLLPVVVVDTGAAHGAARRPEGGTGCHQHGGQKRDRGLPPAGTEATVLCLDEPNPPLTAQGDPAGAARRRSPGQGGDEAEGLVCGDRVEAAGVPREWARSPTRHPVADREAVK